MNDYKSLKITYIGGGSRAWARNLMNDLAKEEDIGGTVTLYDIDKESAEQNAKIANALSAREDIVGKWNYVVGESLKSSLVGADFVIISILPGTFDEMESDVHTPEKYGIYQSVGDTTGPGGIVRSLRTIPMFIEFAEAVKEICPEAWVINFTNPMTVCVKTLYKAFPEIKAFGCCHEVFGTQKVLAAMVEKKLGVKATREEIDVNVLGVNHFTWLDKAYYKNVNLLPMYEVYVKENPDGVENPELNHWANSVFATNEKVKFDLFKRYGVIAAAGDRHLAEFCPGKWYLESPERVKEFGFNLTSVAWRKKDLEDKKWATDQLLNGKPFKLFDTGEETTRQIKALLGLGNFVTNVNIPNVGQMKNIPLGAVVETNAYFSGDSVMPILGGALPYEVNSLVAKVVYSQETVVEAGFTGDYELAFKAFLNDPNVNLNLEDARKLFDEMLYNTRTYLPHYDEYIAKRNGERNV